MTIRPPGFFDRTQKLFTMEQTLKRLKELTGAPPLEPIDPKESNAVLTPIAAKVCLPSGVTPEPPTLEWLAAVRHPNGEATQTSTGGAYAVFGRRGPQGFTYIAKRGLDSLGAFGSAQEARDRCLAHYTDACG